MNLPSGDTPLYNHPLPAIEQWLEELGCEQDGNDLHCWHVERPRWKAEICLEVEEIAVRYLDTDAGARDIRRSFKYSLTREDVESAIFSGP